MSNLDQLYEVARIAGIATPPEGRGGFSGTEYPVFFRFVVAVTGLELTRDQLLVVAGHSMFDDYGSATMTLAHGYAEANERATSGA